MLRSVWVFETLDRYMWAARSLIASMLLHKSASLEELTDLMLPFCTSLSCRLSTNYQNKQSLCVCLSVGPSLSHLCLPTRCRSGGSCSTWSHSVTHTHTQSVGLPWTGDRPVAETSTWQRSQETDSQAPSGIRTTRSESKRANKQSCNWFHGARVLLRSWW